MRARLPFLRHIRRKTVHGQNVLQQRAISALFGIDHCHLGRILPFRSQTTHSGRRKVHLLPLSAGRMQFNGGRLFHTRRTAQGIELFFHFPNLGRRIQFGVQDFAFDCNALLFSQLFEPFQAVIDGRKEPSIRCGIGIRFNRQR